MRRVDIRVGATLGVPRELAETDARRRRPPEPRQPRRRSPPAPTDERREPCAASVASLDPRFTFDSFVVGKPNEFAYACARRVAERPASPASTRCSCMAASAWARPT